MSNAIKYSGPGGRVEVGVSADPVWLSIAVRDNGIGMDIGQLDQLFDPFNPLDRHGIAAFCWGCRAAGPGRDEGREPPACRRPREGAATWRARTPGLNIRGRLPIAC